MVDCFLGSQQTDVALIVVVALWLAIAIAISFFWPVSSKSGSSDGVVSDEGNLRAGVEYRHRRT